MFLSAPLLLCDVIELKTGERLEGTFKQATAAGVVIEWAGQPITLPLVKVRAIYFGEAAVLSRVPGATTNPKRDALQALNGLRALTQVRSVNHRDYDLKLAEVTAKVEELFPLPPTEHNADGTVILWKLEADTDLVWRVLLQYQRCSVSWAEEKPAQCLDTAAKKLSDALAQK